MPVKSTIKLLRIPFSLMLMPVFLLALSQAGEINAAHTIVSFAIIHLLVYPASNGYNSYVDRDQSSIGGLEHPPMPTPQLFYLTALMDLAAVLLSLLCVSLYFSLCILIYIMASRAYSSRQIRFKKYPVLGFLTVVIFQGGFSYFMCSVGIAGSHFQFPGGLLFILIACSFQIAGAYPLTQIYQHQQDLDDGVVTLSYKLGYRGTFIFTACMFALCNTFYFLYFKSVQHLNQFALLQLLFLPIIIYFLWWFKQVIVNTREASFRNSMRMNMIAAFCMNSCFLLLIFLRIRL